jgi:hypothetical protein
MLRKKGSVLPPSGENLGPYPKAIAYALKCELGPTHQAVKIIMKWTGAGERTVKNWLAGISGPSGQHLVELIRNSDIVLQVLLTMAGRPQTSAVQHLGDVRKYLSQTLESIDQLIADE